jgi:hypothetical protein
MAFLKDELFSMTLMATVQRGKVYSAGATEGQKDAVRQTLRSELEQLTPNYREAVPETQHVENIASLANRLSAQHSHALDKGRFRIGSAQKALNLHLKYLWCLDLISLPPHCPFDAIVLSRIPGCSDVRWTALDSLEEYEKIVRAARAVACDCPLPLWELRLYNAAQPGGPAVIAPPGMPATR